MTKQFDAPQVLIAEHKHHNTYYVVNSSEDVLRAKAQMIRTWHEYEMFYEPDEPYISKKDEEIGVLTDEQIAALPEAFRDAAKRARVNITRAQQEFERQKRDVDLASAVVNAASVDEAIAIPGPNGRGTAVEHLVRAYGGHEYTEWSLDSGNSLTDW